MMLSPDTWMSSLGAAGLVFPLLVAALPILYGTSGFVDGANILVELGTSTSADAAVKQLLAAASLAANPTAIGEMVFALLTIARIEAGFETGMAFAGLYALATQPVEARHVLHLAFVISFILAVFTNLVRQLPTHPPTPPPWAQRCHPPWPSSQRF